MSDFNGVIRMRYEGVIESIVEECVDKCHHRSDVVGVLAAFLRDLRYAGWSEDDVQVVRRRTISRLCEAEHAPFSLPHMRAQQPA